MCLEGTGIVCAFQKYLKGERNTSKVSLPVSAPDGWINKYVMMISDLLSKVEENQMKQSA